MRAFLAIALAACSAAPAPAPRASTAVQVLASPAYVVLHVLTGAEGADVRGYLTELGGRLYGLAGEGGPLGPENCQGTTTWGEDVQKRQCPGTLFSLLPDGSDFRIEHAFTPLDELYRNADGYHPYGSLEIGPDGRLWGVTQMGGVPPCSATGGGVGVLFSYDARDSTFRTEHAFCTSAGAPDGRYPMGSVAVLGEYVFGTSKGSANVGNSFVVWRWGPHDFTYAQEQPKLGWGAYGGLTAIPGGLVGMTFAGGDGGRGAYFEVDPFTLEATARWSFPAFTTNQWGKDNTPIQRPTVVSNGDVVAQIEFGGGHGTGIVADLTLERVLREMDDIAFASSPRFANASGAMPNGRIVEGLDGMLYGTSMYGGANGTGVIYRVARDGSMFQVLHSFDATGPARPYGGLTLASDGKLYGVTHAGKAIFRFDTGSPDLVGCR